MTEDYYVATRIIPGFCPHGMSQRLSLQDAYDLARNVQRMSPFLPEPAIYHNRRDGRLVQFARSLDDIARILDNFSNDKVA